MSVRVVMSCDAPGCDAQIDVPPPGMTDRWVAGANFQLGRPLDHFYLEDDWITAPAGWTIVAGGTDGARCPAHPVAA